MTETDIHINLTPVVAAVLSVLVEPYKTFVAELHRAGRITDAELAELRHVILDRGERLAGLAQAELRASAQPPISDPGSA